MSTIELTGDRPAEPVDEFLRSLGIAMLWYGLEVAANTAIPGAGLAFRAVHVGSSLLAAAESVAEGRGFVLQVPLADVAGIYSINISVRLDDARDDALPALRVLIEENWPGASWLNSVGVDRVAADEEWKQPTVDLGIDMETLVKRAAEYACMAGSHGESWQMFVDQLDRDNTQRPPAMAEMELPQSLQRTRVVLPDPAGTGFGESRGQNLDDPYPDISPLTIRPREESATGIPEVPPYPGPCHDSDPEPNHDIEGPDSGLSR